MKWTTFDAEGNAREVDGAELGRELEAADAAARGTPESRDWRECPSCKGYPLAAVELVFSQGTRELWSCPRCRCSVSFVAEGPGLPFRQLTRFQWSQVRHAACIPAFGGHQQCLPEQWFKRLEVSPDGLAVESPELGRLELRRFDR